MKPHVHARNSAKKFGGKPEDYQEIHDFLDSSKACMSDMRHRAAFHSAFGCFLAERVFGILIQNSDGKSVSVRDVAEQHIVEDLGFIPRMDQWFAHMSLQDWMGGGARKRAVAKFIPID